MTTRQIIAAIGREMRCQDLSRAELARRAGFSRQAITNMLNQSGDRRLQPADVLAIVQALRPDLDPVKAVLTAAGML